ncbi:MAG: phospholipase A [Marinobacter sp.]|uniref:phospholipase A n=1 Tax=Marinobacter sp. TaxID=50741 RepID=UPI00299E8C8D|nr:phospholipase A [Marinobacter sp.]MDX1633230.1 phospholipase A [Marinobacter sp.]
MATPRCFCFATLVLVPTAALAQSPQTEREVVPLEDCALIENGVQRLACYDAVLKPESAQKRAGPEQEKAVERATDTLEVNGTGEVTDAADGEAQDGDNGVMNALMNRYVATERALFSFSGSFVSYRPTYVMPLTYVDSPNTNPSSPTLGETSYDAGLDDQEAKYQISFKVPLLTGVFDERTTLWFGYTQLSFWQLFNADSSKPFRETNYEPEIFARYQTDLDIGPGTLNTVSLSLNHESNGRSEPRSRSWNRITSMITYSYDRWLFIVNPWYRIPEDSDEDDNPDIERYLGYGNFWAVYKWNDDKTLSLKLRNNFRSNDNRTSVQLGYSFPMGGTLKGYVEYYNGYGESLIDYNERIQRVGIGVMLNDWL